MSKSVPNADGSNPTQLTTGTTDKYRSPQPSADGSKVTYSLNNSKLFVVGSSGGTATQIPTQAQGSYADDPTFTPDGSKIVFEGQVGIYIMNADGSGLTQLTTDSLDSQPSVPPTAPRSCSAEINDPIAASKHL